MIIIYYEEVPMRKSLIAIPLILSVLTIFIISQLMEEHSVTPYIYKNSFQSAEISANSAAIETTELETTTLDTTALSANAVPSFTIKLSFVGDCLCATDARTSYANCFEEVADREDPEYFLSKVSHLFLNDDFTIADCENVFSDSKNLTMRDKGQIANPDIEAYWFKTKAKNANILSVGGIDMVSIENNHIDDYGSQGHSDTQKALDSANVLWGEEGKIVYYKKNGYKIAVICVSMYNYSVVETIKDYISKASKKSDYQIIYFHGGQEAVHSPESWKINACRAFIDSGADLVIGDHPHVLQPREIYKNKTIIYSMGNFIFGGNRHPENRTIIYQHTLSLDNSNKLISEEGKIIPCYVYTGDINNWQPAIIKDKATKKKVLDFMKGKTDSPL